MDSLVSVAMATYNGEKYLEEQLDSILNQTYKNIEVIICDDCSTDKTREIITKYADSDKRIKYCFNEENLGYSKNFQKAVSLCTGDYIALSDQDDIWNLNKIEISLNNIKNYDLLCTNSLLVDENNNSINITMKDTVGYRYIPKKQEQIFKFLCHKNFVQGSTILAKTSFIKNITVPEDFYHDYWYAFNAVENNGIIYLNKCTIRYRQHKKQVTTNNKKKNDLFTIGNKNELSCYIKNKTIFLSKLEQLNLQPKHLSFIKETKKYIQNLADKNMLTLRYYIKNYNILYFDHNPILKIFRILKKTTGLFIHFLNKSIKRI